MDCNIQQPADAFYLFGLFWERNGFAVCSHNDFEKNGFSFSFACRMAGFDVTKRF